MKRELILALALGAAYVLPSEAKTKAMLFFDTEDFTCNESNDPIRETAKILTEEGVRGQYNIVGYLARELVRLGRTDVIEALKPHCLGTQTLKHSVHPTICEQSDMVDYGTAYRNVLADEAEGVGMLKAAFGLQAIDYAVPPGDSWSYVGFYVFADLGMTFYGGGGFCDDGENHDKSEGLVPSGLRRSGMWYCNMLQLPYSHLYSLEYLIPCGNKPIPDYKAALDECAKRDLVVFYMHPNKVNKTEFWDFVNYRGKNMVEWGKWNAAKDRPKADVEVFYRNFRAFVKAVKADSRFEFTDIETEKAKIRPRVAIERKDLASVKSALEKDFGTISSPASWCVADVFQAVVTFLRGDDAAFRPDKAYGFLARPRGVKAPVTVKVADLRAAAAKLDLSTFIPPTIDVGGVALGPADFLFAGLEALVTGADAVTVRPREQLGSFRHCPSLETVDIKGGWCIHSPDLNGALLDERLKLQLWTLRFEN